MAIEDDLNLDAVIEAYKRNVDRTLIRENLRKTPEERLMRLQRMQAFVDGLHTAVETIAEIEVIHVETSSILDT